MGAGRRAAGRSARHQPGIGHGRGRLRSASAPHRAISTIGTSPRRRPSALFTFVGAGRRAPPAHHSASAPGRPGTGGHSGQRAAGPVTGHRASGIPAGHRAGHRAAWAAALAPSSVHPFGLDLTISTSGNPAFCVHRRAPATAQSAIRRHSSGFRIRPSVRPPDICRAASAWLFGQLIQPLQA